MYTKYLQSEILQTHLFLLVAIIVILLFFYFKLSQIMVTNQQFQAVLDRIDTATNAIAEDTGRIATTLRELKDQIANQGLPADAEAAILAKLDSSATSLEQKAEALKSVGKDPIPEEEEGESEEG